VKDTLNLTTLIWNDEVSDWALHGVNVIISRILYLSRAGAIILLHDGGGYHAQTVAALPTIITILQERGYKFVTVQQLVQDMTRTPQASPINPPTS